MREVAVERARAGLPLGSGTGGYQMLPPLPAEDLERLRADIEARGVQVPVELDEHGNVLDGHHRKAIAEELGVDYPTVVRQGLSDSEKRLHAGMLNLARRQLTDGQKVWLGRQLEPDIAATARERMAQGGRGGAARKGGSDDPPLEKGTKTRVRDEVAERVGLGSGETYERGRKVLDWADRDAPELVELVAQGEASIHEVRRVLRQRELDREQEQSAELVQAAVEQVPTAATMLRVAQQRSRMSAARAAIRRALLELDPQVVAELAEPEDRPGWGALASELGRWAQQMDGALKRSGLRLVPREGTTDEGSGH